MTTVTVGADEIRAAVSMAEAIDAVRDAFRELAAGDFVLPARQIFGDGRCLVMSAHHTPTGTAVVKKTASRSTRCRRSGRP